MRSRRTNLQIPSQTWRPRNGDSQQRWVPGPSGHSLRYASKLLVQHVVTPEALVMPIQPVCWPTCCPLSTGLTTLGGSRRCGCAHAHIASSPRSAGLHPLQECMHCAVGDGKRASAAVGRLARPVALPTQCWSSGRGVGQTRKHGAHLSSAPATRGKGGGVRPAVTPT